MAPAPPVTAGSAIITRMTDTTPPPGVPVLLFGPDYCKIDTIWKRDTRNVVIPGDYSTPELAYLGVNRCPFRWHEKVDGMNVRLHWNGQRVTIGGREDNAQLPSVLVANLHPYLDPALWHGCFPASEDGTADVTVYGEGYGGSIRPGSGTYGPDQSFIVFDVNIGGWWLKEPDVADVAGKLGLETVPAVGEFPVSEAWRMITDGDLKSAFPGAVCEGLVGQPAVPLLTRGGARIITKMKVKDWADYQRRADRRAPKTEG
jgi:RNA ligase